VIGWLAVSYQESAVWTVLTRVAVATAALSLVIGIATGRQAADRHGLTVDPQGTDARKTYELIESTKASFDDRGEGAGPVPVASWVGAWRSCGTGR